MQFDMLNFTIAAPVLALAAGALVVLCFDLLMPAKRGQIWWYVASIASVALAGYYMLPLWNQGHVGFAGGMIMDQLTLTFGLVLLLTTLLTTLLSFARGEEDKAGYLALVLWAASGMFVMISAGTLMTLFLGLELLSLSLYVAVAFDGKRPMAREAALKYFVLGSVASAFMLFGFALLYGVTGSMELKLIAANAVPGDLFYKVGIGLAMMGFAFKIALVPFHSWAPDVYEGAPTSITAFMSVGTKAAAFATLGRFLINVVPAENQAAFLLPLAIFAALSMVLGATVGIWQTDLKRLMAYSGIAHAGYLIMAIPTMGSEGMTAAVYYMAAYGFTAMGIFAIIQLLESEGLEGSKLSTLKGLYYRRPGLAASMAIFMFALAGLPPTGGFIGKLLLAKAAVGADAWLLLGALMLSTGVSAYVYLRVIGTMFRQVEETGVKRGLMAGAAEREVMLSPEVVRFAILAVLVIALVGTVVTGILPGPVLELLTTTIH